MGTRYRNCLHLLVATSLWLPAVAQVYHPFPTSGTMWSVGKGSSDCWMFGLGEGFMRIETTGDTVISGHTYAKIQEVYSNYSCGIYQAWGAVRNDIPERKVYFVPWGSTEEQVLYDHSLVPGETFDLFGNGPLLLDSIDSVEVSTEYHRRFNFSDQPIGTLFQVIEGIGATIGVTSGQDTVDDDTWLICMEQDGVQFYEFIPDACAIYTGVAHTNAQDEEFSLFPNPTNGRLVLQLDDQPVFSRLTLDDALGNAIISLSAGLFPLSLDVSGLPSGIYLIEFYGTGSVHFNGRFIRE